MPRPLPMIQICPICGVVKTDDNALRRKRNPENFASWCKACTVKKQAERRAKKSGWHRVLTYGLSQEDFLQLKSSQGGKCVLCCREFEKTPCVDHCHETGKIRGLLCRLCNVRLSVLEPGHREWKERAEAYLKQHA